MRIVPNIPKSPFTPRTIASTTMIGPLILAWNPAQPTEASTKQYVDSKFSSLNADNIISGIFPIGGLPEYTGDITNNPGTNYFTLTNTGVIAGSYPKVIVDSKGRVLSGSNLSNSDLPSFNWSKVSLKPTTLIDYGITDALSTSGGVLTNNLGVQNPTQPLSCVNKQYIDTLLANSGGSNVTGDIVVKPYATTPNGFLRCNGALVSKTTYANLYAVIGDNFINNPYVGAGKPWNLQYGLNQIPSAELGPWTTESSLPESLRHSQVVVTKNRVYLLGGIAGWNVTSTVYTAPINTDGTLGTWTAGTPLPEGASFTQAVTTKNRVYLIGGYNGIMYSSTVYTAPINADGTLGAWTTSNPLPLGFDGLNIIVTKTKIHVIGGYSNDGYIGSSYTADINADGSLGNWDAGPTLPTFLGYGRVFVIKNTVYLVGSYTDSGNDDFIFKAVINANDTLSTWSVFGSLPLVRNEPEVIVTSNKVYLLGGYDSNGVTNKIYESNISADGSLGPWTEGAPNSYPVNNYYGMGTIVTSSRIYLIGGTDSNGATTNAVVSSPLSGGLNDYSPYYDSNIVYPTDPNNFALPDLKDSEHDGLNYYIKL